MTSLAFHNIQTSEIILTAIENNIPIICQFGLQEMIILLFYAVFYEQPTSKWIIYFLVNLSKLINVNDIKILIKRIF